MVMFTPYIGNLKNEKILFEWPREYNSNLLLFDIYIAIFFQLSIP